MKLTKRQEKLLRIENSREELENSMGDGAALEVACQREGVTSEWYYKAFAECDNAELLGYKKVPK